MTLVTNARDGAVNNFFRSQENNNLKCVFKNLLRFCVTATFCIAVMLPTP